MKKSHLYTRTGDTGTTSLIGGRRVAKTHVRLEAYGTVDELNAQLGLLSTYLTQEADRQTVCDIQNLLFCIGAELATEPTTPHPAPTSTLTAADVQALEQATDEAEDGVPAPRGFILPGGTRGAAVAHVCRTVCRRAERRIHALALQAPVSPLLLAYMNRLSDYLFALSKKINHLEATDEKIWVKREAEPK